MEHNSDSNRSEEFDTGIKAVTYLILYILPPVLFILGCWNLLFILGCWNLYLASELGNRDGLSLSDMFQNWQDGLDITRQYSHTYLMAMKRISNAVRQLSSALMMICVAAALLVSKKRKNRL